MDDLSHVGSFNLDLFYFDVSFEAKATPNGMESSVLTSNLTPCPLAKSLVDYLSISSPSQQAIHTPPSSENHSSQSELSKLSPQLVSQDSSLGSEAVRHSSRVRKPPERYGHNIYDT